MRSACITCILSSVYTLSCIYKSNSAQLKLPCLEIVLLLHIYRFTVHHGVQVTFPNEFEVFLAVSTHDPA